MANDPEMDDLLLRLSAGESEAVGQFVERFQRQILRCIELSLRRRGRFSAHGPQSGFEPRSIFNSTIHVFLDRLKRGNLKFDHPDKVIAYLKVTSDFKIVTRLRAPSQKELLDNAESLIDPSPSPDEVLATKPWKGDMPDSDDRRILSMTAEGKTMREIAEELGLKRATVHRRLQTIIASLKALYHGE